MNYLDFKIKPKNGFGFVYMYTSPSQKKYIGQTTYSIFERAGMKGARYKNCSVFFSAIQKYGIENFKIKILEEVPECELYEKEEYYIKKYNTLVPNGYNCCLGKSGYRETKKLTAIEVYDKDLNYIESFVSMIECAKKYKIPWQAISQCARGEIEHYKEKVYVYLGEEPKKPRIIKTHGRKVGCFDDNGKLIKIYNSANEAAITIGKNSNAGRNIRSVCEGNRQHAYGFIWKFLD